jgi:hypothetical protein
MFHTKDPISSMTDESSKCRSGGKTDKLPEAYTEVHLKPLYQSINLQQVQDQWSADMSPGGDAQL